MSCFLRSALLYQHARNRHFGGIGVDDVIHFIDSHGLSSALWNYLSKCGTFTLYHAPLVVRNHSTTEFLQDMLLAQHSTLLSHLVILSVGKVLILAKNRFEACKIVKTVQNGWIYIEQWQILSCAAKTRKPMIKANKWEILSTCEIRSGSGLSLIHISEPTRPY